MLYMAGGAAAFFVAQFIGPPIIAAAIFVVPVIFVRYAYSVLERTAYGVLSPDDLSGMELPHERLVALHQTEHVDCALRTFQRRF
jgi:hypothetical protein